MPTHYNGTQEEILALDSYIKLSRAADSINSRLSNSPSMQELTISQFGVLEALVHLGPLCQNVLGSKILKSNSNMTTVIDNLEKRGLVKRERNSEDRRMITIHLTMEGKEIIETVLPQHVAAIKSQFEVLTQEEQIQLGNLLRKLGRQG
ncbi:MAG: MarR family winged helix-turn-helix transcriptional regulator [Anaerolineaceae bacterium]